EQAEALERETATADVLRLISSAPTSLQPVFDALVDHATRLCAADGAVLNRWDGDDWVQLSILGADGRARAGGHIPEGAVRGLVAVHALRERRTIHVPDVEAEADTYPDSASYAQRTGNRTLLSTPLLREGQPIGQFSLVRSGVHPFSEQQIGL